MQFACTRPPHQGIGTVTADKEIHAFRAHGHDVFYSPFSPEGIVRGNVAPGWESVREAFAMNFAEGWEQGAQLCVYHQGKSYYVGCFDDNQDLVFLRLPKSMTYNQ